MSIQYLAAATNRLTELMQPAELKSEDFRSASGIACKTLNTLYSDPDLDSAFDELAEADLINRRTVNFIVQDLDHFASHFLCREMQLLEEKCGIDPRMLEALRKAAKDLQSVVRNGQPNLLAVKQRIATLR